MSVSAALIIFGVIAFLLWAIPSFIKHVFFPGEDVIFEEPKEDERSSIQQFNNIMGRDYKPRP